MIQVLTSMVLLHWFLSSDVLITNSDFLDNSHPYLQSITGDVTFDSLVLSNNVFFDVIASIDASF